MSDKNKQQQGTEAKGSLEGIKREHEVLWKVHDDLKKENLQLKEKIAGPDVPEELSDAVAGSHAEILERGLKGILNTHSASIEYVHVKAKQVYRKPFRVDTMICLKKDSKKDSKIDSVSLKDELESVINKNKGAVDHLTATGKTTKDGAFSVRVRVVPKGIKK